MTTVVVSEFRNGKKHFSKYVMIEAEHLSGAEIKFIIPKDRYEEVKIVMSNGSNCCYLIFDRNSGSFLRSESSEIGN